MIRFFAAHPTAANMLMVLFIGLGLMALPTLQRATLPDFTAQEVEVRVVYRGASALDVEEGVCLRIEDAVDGISGVDELRCEAREGVGIATVEMREGADFARFLDDVKTEVEAIDSFPALAESPVVTQRGRTDPVVSVALTGVDSPVPLKALAEQIKEAMTRLPGVSLVTVDGFSQHQFRIALDEHALRSHGLGVRDVADAIARQSVDLPAGMIETHDLDVLIRFTDLRRTPADLAGLVILGEPARSGEVLLGDVAAISDRFALDEAKVLVDGRRAAVLRVEKNKEEDVLTALDAVRAFVETERERLPPGVALTLTADRASIVRDRLQLLVRNGVQGTVLVFLVMWLFFHVRFSFWVTMGLPVSFLGGLFVMSLAGMSINMLSMVALLVGIGLLMDDAIVISENVATHVARGERALDAVVAGVREVAPGVVSSFLTTAAVFGPLAFLAGDIGKVLEVVPVVLIIVLSVSLVEAFLILPRHLSHTLAHGVEAGRFRRAFDASLERFREQVLGRLVDWLVARRYAFIGTVLAVLVVTVSMVAGGRLGFKAFPDLEGDTVEARVLLPPGTPLARTESVVEVLTGALARVEAELGPAQPGGAGLVRHVTVTYDKNVDAYETGPHVVTVGVDLLGSERRTVAMDDVINRWRDEVGAVPDVVSLSFKEPTIGPAGKDIEIRLTGGDLATLDAASDALQVWLAGYHGVNDVFDDLRPGKLELRLRMKPGALGLGVDAASVAAQVRAAFQGETAVEIQVGVEPIDVDVQLAPHNQSTLDDLEYFRVVAADGSLVPLRSVVDVETARGVARIHRVDGRRTVTVEGSVDTALANAAAVTADTIARFVPTLRERFPAVDVDFEGQQRESAITGASLARGFLIGLAGIFVLLSVQFRSYVEPVVVMLAIPLAFIGVVWGHLAMGLSLSMPSMIGFVSLAGVVVNDSILLVQFMDRRLAAGEAIVEAATSASRARMRAVLLTSLTTIAGLLPLLSEKSLQAQVLIPLATSIVFGLLASTLLILLVLPAVLAILDDLGLAMREVSGPQGGPPAGEAGAPA